MVGAQDRLGGHRPLQVWPHVWRCPYNGSHDLSTVLDSFPGGNDVICSNVAARSVVHVLARVFLESRYCRAKGKVARGYPDKKHFA